MTTTSDTRSPIAIDPRSAFAATIPVAAEVIDAVRAEHLALPTPCDGMTVEDLLSHLMMVADRVASAGRGDELATWSTEGPKLGLIEWAPAWRAVAATAVDEWSDDTRLERSTPLPWTTLPGRGVVAIYTNELVVHTWDLATAIGASASWPDEVLDVASAAIHSQLPDADRTPMWAAMAAHMPEGIAWESPFSNAVEISDDSTPVARVMAWNGRNPAWTAG